VAFFLSTLQWCYYCLNRNESYKDVHIPSYIKQICHHTEQSFCSFSAFPYFSPIPFNLLTCVDEYICRWNLGLNNRWAEVVYLNQRLRSLDEKSISVGNVNGFLPCIHISPTYPQKRHLFNSKRESWQHCCLLISLIFKMYQAYI